LKILVATKNKGKMREMKEFLQTNGLEVLSLTDLSAQTGFSNAPDVEETGKTFEENALLKAKTYFEWSGIPSVADDGGLEIDFLNGEPGVKSRRWLGYEMTDQELIDLALKKLGGVPKEKRTARLRTVVIYYDGKNILSETTAIEGYITERQEKECEAGYPFRAIFWVPKFSAKGGFQPEADQPLAGAKNSGGNKLFQDLSHDEHEAINHRREACFKLKERIKKSFEK